MICKQSNVESVSYKFTISVPNKFLYIGFVTRESGFFSKLLHFIRLNMISSNRSDSDNCANRTLNQNHCSNLKTSKANWQIKKKISSHSQLYCTRLTFQEHVALPELSFWENQTKTFSLIFQIMNICLGKIWRQKWTFPDCWKKNLHKDRKW